MLKLTAASSHRQMYLRTLLAGAFACLINVLTEPVIRWAFKVYILGLPEPIAYLSAVNCAISMERLDMSLTASGMLVLAMSIASNVLQLAFGYWQDKYNLSSLLLWVIPLGALAICGVGWANSQPLLFLIAILNGLAVAAFHPLGSTLVTRAASGGKLGQKMSYYLTGGNFGFAAAPLAVVWFMRRQKPRLSGQ